MLFRSRLSATNATTYSCRPPNIRHGANARLLVLSPKVSPKSITHLRAAQPCVKLASMDTRSRRSATTPTKSTKLLTAEKRSKIATKTKAKAKTHGKRKLATLAGYLIADEKLLVTFLDRMPEAYEELRRFLPCAIERLGKRRIALIPYVNAVGKKIVLVAIEFNPPTIAAGHAVAKVIRDCGPTAGLDSLDMVLMVGASSDVREDLERAKSDV